MTPSVDSPFRSSTRLSQVTGLTVSFHTKQPTWVEWPSLMLLASNPPNYAFYFVTSANPALPSSQHALNLDTTHPKIRWGKPHIVNRDRCFGPMQHSKWSGITSQPPIKRND
uniref:Uncharacterized protein n=1 Tax=Coccidioides posadasii RMSCC 3488 TaxID=454284 RepID=A0A0J6F8F4_COCPO|nr:hypothetical protein CPAG_01910 [Coccidioides posadasii RMSCC 3488]